ncbi:MAG: type III-A CRISPR-associated protein Csm2 [Chitinophagales bacterium]|nr:type III-A CRISPR-associated protein Csm2 [Chitinophagales bacterium]
MAEFIYKGVNDPNSHLKLTWIHEGIKDDVAIEWSKAFAKHLVTEKMNDPLHHLQDRNGFAFDRSNRPRYRLKLSTTQLRKFFGELKGLEANTSSNNFNVAKVKMIKPKLAYAVGKEKSQNPKINDLYIEFERAINGISEYTHFKNFIQLFEAVVAYHKYFENNKN